MRKRILGPRFFERHSGASHLRAPIGKAAGAPNLFIRFALQGRYVSVALSFEFPRQDVILHLAR